MRITTIVILLVTMGNIFAQGEQKKDFSLAKAGDKIYGVYVFVASEPYYEYDYIKTIQVKITWNGTVSESFEKVIKKAKRKYNFNGMIFHNDNFSKADLIVFRDLKVKIQGFGVGDNVNFLMGKKSGEGKIIKLMKDKASIRYGNNGKNKVISVKYRNLSKL